MCEEAIKQNDFSHVYGPGFNTQDGIMGNRDTSQGTVDATYTIPMAGSDGKGSGEPVCLQGLSSFVTTRGTAYTLLPSLEAIQRLANLAS